MDIAETLDQIERATRRLYEGEREAERQVGYPEDGQTIYFPAKTTNRRYAEVRFMRYAAITTVLVDAGLAYKTREGAIAHARSLGWLSEGQEGSSENRYLRPLRFGGWVDIYEITLAYRIACPFVQHTIKKLLPSGLRVGGKSADMDIAEATDQLLIKLAREGKLHLLKAARVQMLEDHNCREAP